ncbi:hypothetical protein LMS44_10615 [Halomonas profundus]|uniref:hypothetical protein n=1 Tax=unclassified Halomonas TaxID=2609666 RepID=UPI0004AEFCEA|nr:MULTISPECIES: hypothetical protein [unclassified Halomonas]UEQ06296.1 hypothetical protein LMS44_10615 [Halomonas profundus]
MKMLYAALIIALTLVSGVALAERGSDEGSRIISPESTSTQKDSEEKYFSPSDLTDKNP